MVDVVRNQEYQLEKVKEKYTYDYFREQYLDIAFEVLGNDRTTYNSQRKVIYENADKYSTKCLNELNLIIK